jgi:hypothetical protein
MHGCSSQCGAYRAFQGCYLSLGRNFAGSPLRVVPTQCGTLGGRPLITIQKSSALLASMFVILMLVLAAHDHHAREVRKARRPGRWRVPLPLLLLHLRPQYGQPSMPCAGLRLARSRGAPPRLSGITWSMDCEPGCPQIQHTSEAARICRRSRRHGRPCRPGAATISDAVGPGR